ncbi:hypothetical protein HWV62_20306 [Athelia sp. TMB]|nr:hypothetical protein HWV62_20306 [Athelia sp. TMB]
MGVRKSISESEFSDNDEISNDDDAGSLSEEEPEDRSDAGTDAADSSTRPGRMSHYKKPKISKKTSHFYYSIHKKEPPKAKGKAPAKGRNFGKLSQLKNMSLDILFELSRVSKQFRSLFASKGSRHIWIAAKRNLATGMPECPADLSEPQYISLMFEHNCQVRGIHNLYTYALSLPASQACGKNRAPKTDYALRVRFCGHCFDENTENGRNNAYYFPEIESVVVRYKELESDGIALATFVQEHKETAAQMMKVRARARTLGTNLIKVLQMKDANTLTQWAEDNKFNKAQEDITRMKSRRASIENKLEELGWDRKDFPKPRNYEWSKLLDQPRELTPRIWKLIQPKLEALISARKEEIAKEEMRERSVLRRAELKPIWEKHLMEMGEQDRPNIMPHYLDVAEFAPIKNVLYENEAREPFTQSRWDTVIECLPTEIDTFRTKVIYTLTKRLEADKPNGLGWEKTFVLQSPDLEEAADHVVLERASTLFRCFHYACRETLPGITGILEHEHLNKSAWNHICGKLGGIPHSKAAVQMILKTLQLPENSTFEAVCAYDGNLVCLCGHPQHREPKTFLELV